VSILKNTIRSIKSHLINLPGWRTNRKIVVFESDDWGSIRTPSKEALKRLKKEGLAVEKCKYMMNDALETPEELFKLYEVLQSVTDSKGRPACFTANTIVANPDFERIKESNYKNYFYEPFTKTYLRTKETENSFAAFQEGMAQRLFQPQLHGREHVNISRWMRDLQNEVEETRLGFDYSMTGISAHITNTHRGSYQSALDGGVDELMYDPAAISAEGAQVFEKVFGFPSVSFIAPNYVWSKQVEEAMHKAGVKYLQGTTTQRLPSDFGEKRGLKRHYLGQKNRNGQYYLNRNASFEPTLDGRSNAVANCMKQIRRSFLWGKPAMISTHRVNYIDRLNIENGEKNRVLLRQLLSDITRRWPQVEFMTTDELGSLISES